MCIAIGGECKLKFQRALKFGVTCAGNRRIMGRGFAHTLYQNASLPIMSTSSNLEKRKEHARLLYTRERLNQKEAAKRAGVSEKTMGAWVNKYKWDAERSALTITKERQLTMMHHALNEINDAIANREEGKRFATPGEADTIMKYAAAINKLETDCGIAETISVLTEVTSYVRLANPEKAKEIVDMFDAFIKSKLK